MGGPRELGHRNIRAKPENSASRGGRFAVATVAVLISSLGSCTSSAAPVPLPREIIRARAGEGAEAPAGASHSCAEHSSLLRPGESATDSICLENTTYVLTDSSILIIPNSTSMEGGDRLSVSLSHSRVDVSALVGRGIVDWAASDDAVFVLTEDRRLTPIPRRGFASGPRTRHVLNGDITGAQMQFHSGLLFVGPVSGHLMVMSFSPIMHARAIPLPDQLGSGNQEFIFRGGRLFFGEREGKQIEIGTRGGSPGAVTLEPR